MIPIAVTIAATSLTTVGILIHQDGSVRPFRRVGNGDPFASDDEQSVPRSWPRL
jgi:hypothetical protein